MFFRIFFSIYLIVSLFYGTVPIMGSISLRHILTIMMLGVCYFEGGLKLDRFLKWYIAFLLFYVIVEAGSGYSSYVFGKILGTYLASIVLYMATKVVIEKYNAEHLITNILIILGFINAIEVIGQYLGSPLAIALPQILRIPMSEEDLELVNSEQPLQNVSGLMGIVTSGYFLSAISVLALYNKRNQISILNWAVFAVIFFALFLVQERSGLIAGIICAILYFSIVSIREQRNFKTAFLTSVIAIILITSGFLSQIVSIEDTRYFSVGMSDNKRISIATDAFSWVLQNPIGGRSYYYDMGGYYSHNIFTNALLYGGIIGGGILIGILFVQIFKIINIVSAYFLRFTYSPLLLATCMAYLCYTLNSLFHNYSLVTGGEMILLLWAMIGSLKDIEDNANNGDDDDLEMEEMESDLMIEN